MGLTLNDVKELITNRIDAANNANEMDEFRAYNDCLDLLELIEYQS